jgi:DnaA family protein
MASAALQLPFSFAFAGEAGFGNFLASPPNAAVLAHLQQLAQSPGRLSWLWGEAGSGKTHLMQALCQLHPDAIYLPMQKLLAYEPQCLTSLQQSDFVVIDDIGLVCGKREWEEQLFALCNHLLASEGRLVCTSSATPAQLPFVLADLQSRLQLALVYAVHPLDEAGRAQVLVQRAAARGIELKDEVVSYILARNPRSLHELMTVLDQLDRQALAEQRRVTIPFVKACLGW